MQWTFNDWTKRLKAVGVKLRVESIGIQPEMFSYIHVFWYYQQGTCHCKIQVLLPLTAMLFLVEWIFCFNNVCTSIPPCQVDWWFFMMISLPFHTVSVYGGQGGGYTFAHIFKFCTYLSKVAHIMIEKKVAHIWFLQSCTIFSLELHIFIFLIIPILHILSLDLHIFFKNEFLKILNTSTIGK